MEEYRTYSLEEGGEARGLRQSIRPIYLLNEMDKLFERVIAAQVVRLLLREGSLSVRLPRGPLYGGRAMIRRVNAFAEANTRKEKVVVTVSFDNANAFIFPWGQVREVIKYFQMPPYLAAIVEDYIRGRSLTYVDGNDEHGVTVSYGIP